MTCVICGSEATVEAHLVPRALYRMLAGAEQHGFEGSRFSAGVRFQAKGLFDRDLLCRLHENAFGEADDYGVRFIRTFHEAGRETMRGRVWLAPNPRPDLLVRFMAGLVWRRGMSAVRREGADLDLSHAEARLRRLLFEGDASYDPPLMVRRRTILSQGEPIRELMYEPCKMWGWGDNSWAFLAFGCEMTIKLNPYSSPPVHPAFRANGRDPAWCLNVEPEDAADVEGLVEIGANMLRAARPGRRRRTAG